MTKYRQEDGPTEIPIPFWKDRNWYNHSERHIDISAKGEHIDTL